MLHITTVQTATGTCTTTVRTEKISTVLSKRYQRAKVLPYDNSKALNVHSTNDFVVRIPLILLMPDIISKPGCKIIINVGHHRLRYDTKKHGLDVLL